MNFKKKWSNFKTDLPHQQGERGRRNWGHGLHSLCSYQGKMKPSLAASLIDTFLPSKGRFLDPFAGVGTLPLEAALGGHLSWGFDISPAALPIAKAKVTRPAYDECLFVVAQLAVWIREYELKLDHRTQAEEIRFNGRLEDYFHPMTFREVLSAREYWRFAPPKTPSECLVFSCLMHILHGNRPYALSRNSHPLTPFAPTGPTTYKSVITNLLEKIERAFAQVLPDDFVEGRVFYQDITDHWADEVNDLDAIITSPPFYDSVRFHTGNWMRLWFAGWDAKNFREDPKKFVDERQKSSMDLYDAIFRQARDRLKSDGVLVMHLGKSKKCDMGLELALKAKRYFRVTDLFDESVTHCESHGIRDKGTVTSHQYLVLN